MLADFDRGVQAVTGKRPEALPTREMWRALARAPDFYGTLELMQDAQELWAFAAPHRPTILRWGAGRPIRSGAGSPGCLACMSR